MTNARLVCVVCVLVPFSASAGETPDSSIEPAVRAHVATPLHQAIIAGDYEACRRLVADGAAVNAQENDDDTPLHVAAVRGRPAMAKLLLAHGADLRAKDKSGNTPLDEAVRRRRTEVVEVLRKTTLRK